MSVTHRRLNEDELGFLVVGPRTYSGSKGLLIIIKRGRIPKEEIQSIGMIVPCVHDQMISFLFSFSFSLFRGSPGPLCSPVLARWPRPRAACMLRDRPGDEAALDFKVLSNSYSHAAPAQSRVWGLSATRSMSVSGPGPVVRSAGLPHRRDSERRAGSRPTNSSTCH